MSPMELLLDQVPATVLVSREGDAEGEEVRKRAEEMDGEQPGPTLRQADTIEDMGTRTDTLVALCRGRIRPLLRRDGTPARGGEKIVFQSCKKPWDIIKKHHRALTRQEVLKLRERHARFLGHFGAHPELVHVPIQHIRQTHGITVEHQMEVPELLGEHYPIHGGYAELQKNVDPDAYARVSECLVGLKPGTRFNREEFLNVQQSPFLRQTLELADRDWLLAGQMRSVINLGIDFVEDTGECLDFAGGDNFTMILRNGEWVCACIDGLHPDANTNQVSATALQKVCDGEEIHYAYRRPLVCTLSMVRLLNGLAANFGLERRLAIMPSRKPTSPTIASRVRTLFGNHHPTQPGFDFRKFLHDVRADFGLDT